jgi:adenosylcobinamide amidohydrolase
MKSFRMSTTRVQGVDVAVLVTTGLSNPRRAGDRAEHRTIAARHDQPGTINIVALTSAALTDAAMVEALLTVTEAKAAVLQEVGVLSPVSGQLATGTGTDSVAVVSGTGPQTIAYCGKHVLFGETLAALAIEAVTDSIAWYRSNITEIAVAP